MTECADESLAILEEREISPLTRVFLKTTFLPGETLDMEPPSVPLLCSPLGDGRDKDVLEIPGGHVGAVVGSKASQILYPKLVSWFGDKLARSAAAAE